MKNKKTLSAFAVIAMLGGIPVLAADKQCTRADIGNAQRSIDKVVTWAQLRKAWGDYRQCDTGDVADLFTDALLRLVVDWKGVAEYAAAAQKDPEYMDFLLNHLRSPAAKDDRPTVYARAKKECPKSLDDFCAKVADAAKEGGGSSASTGNDIGIQPLMQPIQVQTSKPEVGKPAAKPDSK
ncbi:MAG TPA: hypothetical protein VKR38_11420 [Usitatibacter sp.]|nr:hypothetical protein [Usitatibacter sp.]